MEIAGKLLVRSEHAKINYTESLRSANPVDRWLSVVMVVTNAKPRIIGGATRYGVKVEWDQLIEGVNPLCAATALHFAAQEFGN
jgi:hypothetical protein